MLTVPLVLNCSALWKPSIVLQMPLSRAEIQKRYREKKKRLEGEKFLKAERERKQKYYVPVENMSS